MPVHIEPVLYRILPYKLPVGVTVEAVDEIDFLKFGSYLFGNFRFQGDPDLPVQISEFS